MAWRPGGRMTPARRPAEGVPRHPGRRRLPDAGGRRVPRPGDRHPVGARSRRTSGCERRAGAPEPAPSRADAPPTDDGDPRTAAAVEAFLRREKGFLQDLGGLVQAHAEELRSMVRAVRRDARPPAATPTAPRDGAARRAGAVGEPEVPAAGADARAEPVAESVAGARAGAGAEIAEDPHDERIDEAASPSRRVRARTTTARARRRPPGSVADEPILLEEPEPARSVGPERRGRLAPGAVLGRGVSRRSSSRRSPEAHDDRRRRRAPLLPEAVDAAPSPRSRRASPRRSRPDARRAPRRARPTSRPPARSDPSPRARLPSARPGSCGPAREPRPRAGAPA